MNDDKFSLKARRATRIPLRVPVVLIVQEQDKPRSWDAWTMIVSTHGARIECKRRFESGDEILVQVPFSGKAQHGRVVWKNSEPNKNGNFEFAVELERPENLWGVGFPPSDWKTSIAATAGAPVVPSPVEIAPADRPFEPNPSALQTPVRIPVQDQPVESASEPARTSEPTAPPDPTPPAKLPLPISETPPPIVNRTTELSECETAMNEQPSGVRPLEHGVLQQPAPAVEPGVNLPWPDSGVAAREGLAPSLIPVGLASAGLELPQPGNFRAAPTVLALGTAGSMLGQADATDRLSSIFDELVESALEARLLGLAERLGAQVEVRIAATEATALARLEQRIDRMVSSQSERLERHAVEIVTGQQQLLEQNVRKLLQEAETNAISRQQEFLENSRQAMRNGVRELMTARKAQLEQETSGLASTVWTNLRQSLYQELPSMEKQFVEQCRTQTERLLAGQSMNQRLEKIVEENTTQFVARFEARSELLRAQSCGQLEQQIEQINNQARQAFVRHIATEFNQGKQLWLQQAQKDLNDLAGQNLQRTRESLSRVLKELGETLIRGACPEVGAVEAVSSSLSGQNDVPETDRLAEGEGCYHLLKTRKL